MEHLIEKELLEGKLIVNYANRETKLEEFVINFQHVSKLLTKAQIRMPNTVKKFLEYAHGLKVETEKEAEVALIQLESFVSFEKQDIKLLTKLKNQKLEQRVNNILSYYDLRGRIGLLKKEVLREKYWAEEERLILIRDGFGAEPNRIGRAIFVTFLSDFEETRYNRDDLECIFCDDVNSLITEGN